MAMTTRPRKRATEPAEPAGIEERLAAIEATDAALARAFCKLAVKLPGGNSAIDRILQQEVGVSISDSELIIAAANRTG
jgi:hypothetical protein